MAAKKKFSDELKADIVNNLVDYSYYDTAIKFGLTRFSQSKVYLRDVVRKMYYEVREDPDRFGVEYKILDLIEKNIEARMLNAQKIKPKKDQPVPGFTDAQNAAKQEVEKKAEQAQELKQPKFHKPAVTEDMDISQKAMGLRDQMARVMSHKLDYLEMNPEEIHKMPIVQLTTAFGTLVDKAQILQGNATEHIAVYAKVDNIEGMSADDAMKHLLTAREIAIEEKKK